MKSRPRSPIRSLSSPPEPAHRSASKAKCREDLEQAVTDARRYGNKALVEEFIDGQEIEVAVLGNEEPLRVRLRRN